MDLIIRGGTVVDGTGRPRFRADVGVADGMIAEVGDLSTAGAAQILDADGLVVAPGFIDIHSHSDFTLIVDPRAQSSISQGVTTEVIGNCGHGCAPMSAMEVCRGNIYGYTPGVPITWRTFSEYLARLEEVQPAVNVAALVPNGNLRLAVVGLADRAATAREISEMAKLLESGLAAGAFGYSTGLEYATERACGEAEITALCRVVAEAGGLYATHTRNRDVSALAAIEEAIRTAEQAGVRLQISHIIPRRVRGSDLASQAVALVDQARARGIDAAFDAHTRLHGITNLSACLPPWALAGDTAEIAARLRDPAARVRMKQYESIISSFGLGGWDRVTLFRSDRRPELVGRSFQELAAGAQDPWDAVYDVLLAEIDDLHRPLCLGHAYDEGDLRTTYEHPHCTIGSDATALAVDGPLAGSIFLGAFTWVGWFFRRFVREDARFTLEEAVHKLTALPAERLRLQRRGVLREGAWADVVAFDPGRFEERGTLETPNRLAEGVSHVVVNGCVTVAQGSATGRRGGAVLRRT